MLTRSSRSWSATTIFIWPGDSSETWATGTNRDMGHLSFCGCPLPFHSPYRAVATCSHHVAKLHGASQLHLHRPPIHALPMHSTNGEHAQAGAPHRAQPHGPAPGPLAPTVNGTA